jgi:hypothetical protein
METAIRTKQKPAKMVRTQNSHLQLVPLAPMNPPTIGPMAGPANGARENSDIAMPLRSASQISASSAPAFVNGQLAKRPERKRKMRMLAVFLESAQPT